MNEYKKTIVMLSFATVLMFAVAGSLCFIARENSKIATAKIMFDDLKEGK